MGTRRYITVQSSSESFMRGMVGLLGPLSTWLISFAAVRTTRLTELGDPKRFVGSVLGFGPRPFDESEA